jgi:hypothetical protein
MNDLRTNGAEPDVAQLLRAALASLSEPIVTRELAE